MPRARALPDKTATAGKRTDRASLGAAHHLPAPMRLTARET